jgi:L,D-peptidoglycan transpeptidase YkuD (ErfK/YbiS/YcfS/YnhG family)
MFWGRPVRNDYCVQSFDHVEQDDGVEGVTLPPEAAGAGPTGAGAETEESHRGVLPFPLKYLGNAGQLILVTSRSWSGTQARLEAFEDGSQGWTCVIGPVPARIGHTGMIPGDRRLQGSGTTPAGTFPITEAFGIQPDPGTLLPYAQITSEDHWWVCDPVSVHYNTLRLGAQGGFRVREDGRRGSERLAAHPEEYPYALVVDFNRPTPDRRRGAGIFLRASRGVATDGGIGVDIDVLLALLRWLDPARHPVTTLAPERSAAQF